ncbi:osmoprotectant transport system ATP-binding protein [Propionispira arboris]|uniref:Quaternary amine transport ATP-binding protein n=1 Tax=Propionispira arboris TaxID=84035 RepID=A0A1H6X7C4_9FIRM|nr:ABC transporter ATP-binding protein [Propionispira arboris]SEJ20445.1 osmoprotectant transport system ATP-binding protein [Propionispira arboris]
MIVFKNVNKVYSKDFHAVENMNLHIEEGELFALIGPSGSGKSTTMKMINRLIEPTSGTVLINNKNIAKENPVALRRNIGYVIQHIGLLPHMTIGDNIALVPRLKKWDKEKSDKRVNELLDMVNLPAETYRNRYPAELSGGQQQRIGVIRALAGDPPIVLMDEPFSALDPISREQLQDDLLDLQTKFHKTIVFVTHDIDEAIKLADRIGIMQAGKLIQFDTPEQILRHPVNDFVRTFIGADRINQIEKYPTIEEVMVHAITTFPSFGLAEGLTKMRKYKVDSLLIVDKDKTFLGVANAREIQKNFSNEKIVLADIMKRDIHTIKLSQELGDAINLISEHNVEYLPVLNENNKLKGLITRASLVDVMANQMRTNNNDAVIGGNE